MSKKKFTEDVLAEYLRRIAIDGRSARAVGKDSDMPSYEAFYQLKNRHQDVQARYNQAIEARATAIDDRIDEVLKDVREGNMDYQAGRLEIDTQKWRMAKFFPRLYGDNQKLEVEHKTSFVDELKRVAARVEQAKLEGAEVIDVVSEGGNTYTATPAPAEAENDSQQGSD
tara:strand:- start:124 stop:633 length:510 start_codon:yes stop_codon:yes gene_type:complete